MLLFMFIFGLIIGSFLNMLIYRLPLSIEGQNYSIIEPKHSICPNCQMQLNFLQLIPLFGFLIQKGKCQHCHKAIAWRYPVIELCCALMSLLMTMQLGLTLELVFYLAFGYIALALFVIDIQHQLLPDVLTLSLLYLGLLFYLDDYVYLRDGVIGAIVGYLSLWGVYWLFKLTTGKEGFGYGDFKLTAALGAWLGWKMLPILLSVSAGLALIFALFKGIRLTQRFSFGPFLLVVAAVLLLTNKIAPW